MGDAIFELMVRRELLREGSRPAGKLHALAVRRVSASAQASAWEALTAALTQEEEDMLRRGRNAHTSRVPKSCTPEEYRRATAIEALFGYLYLKGRAQRLEELFHIINNAILEGDCCEG